MTRKMLTVTRKAYKRKDGTTVGGARYRTPDKGKLGRTPKGERWYTYKVETGWRKDDKQVTRRGKALQAHKGDLLATARSLIALHNVTADADTRRAAKSDYQYFLQRYSKEKK